MRKPIQKHEKVDMANHPAVSANALFHFTDFKGLVGILNYNFYPRYSREDHSAFLGKQDGNEIALPMVCFCDIPLTKTRHHASIYGDGYAIGLTKKWGKRKNISPVMYYLENSISAKAIKSSMMDCKRRIDEDSQRQWDKIVANSNDDEDFESTWDNLFSDDEEGELVDSMSSDFIRIQMYLERIVAFTKKYNGSQIRKGITHENVCFYDEREWRYVPDAGELILKGLKPFLNKKSLKSSELIDKANYKIEQAGITLEFTPNDIKYIVVPNENAIIPLVQELENIKGKKYQYPSEVVKLLTTRIIPLDGIFQDF